jgi:hypothetical protein
VRLVVERHIARDDGDSERLARFRHPLDCLRELPGDLGLLRVPEVEAVRDRKRPSARTGDVSRGFEDCELPAGAWIKRGEPAGAVQRDREPAERGAEAEHGGIETRTPHRARADEMVVALVDRRPATHVGRREKAQELFRPGADRSVGDLSREATRLDLDPVPRRLLGEEARRNRTG